MENLKESKKEELPLSFLTAFVSKGWDEVGMLKEQLNAIKQQFTGTKRIEDLIQSLIDAYLVCIGQVELHMDKKDYLEYPEESNLGNTVGEDKKANLDEDYSVYVQNDPITDDTPEGEGYSTEFDSAEDAARFYNDKVKELQQSGDATKRVVCGKHSFNMDAVNTKPEFRQGKRDLDVNITPDEVEAEDQARDKDEAQFEYFCDFDDPDMSEPRLTDDDLYPEN